MECNNNELTIAYHGKCLDGFFSSFMVYLGLKGCGGVNELVEYLNWYFRESENGKKYEGSRVKSEWKTSEKSFFEEKFAGVRYYEAQYKEKSSEVIGELKELSLLSNSNSKKSLLLLDYTFKEVIEYVELEKAFDQIYIIDHHDTILTSMKIPEPKTPTRICENTFLIIDLKEAGVTLTARILEKILIGFEEFTRLNEKVKMYDTKKPFDLDSEALASFLIPTLKGNYLDFPNLHSIFSKSTEIMLEIGRRKFNEIEEKSQNALENAQIITIKTKIKGLMKCYFVFTKDSSIVNRAGILLAEKSLKEFGNDIGVLGKNYIENGKRHIQIRGSGVNGLHLGNLAMEFGGGGHPGAASFFIDLGIYKKWFHPNK